MADIYTYREYRLFLQDRLTDMRKKDRSLNYRTIATSLGLKSAGHITQILKGTAALSAKVLPRVIDFLGLTAREERYFRILVTYEQSGTFTEKRTALRELLDFRTPGAVRVTETQNAFYEHWFVPVIRDILSTMQFSGNFKDLAAAVVPAITVDEAQQAIRALEALGLVIKNESGIYQATATLLEAPEDAHTALIRADYAARMIDRGRESLDRFDRSERTISWAGFSVSEESYRLIADEIHAFQERVLEITKADDHPDRVYHMNIQCFPVSRKGALS